MALDAEATTPRRAREAVAEVLAEEPCLPELLLCVSEVVTNAVVHTRSPRRLRVTQRPGAVRVEVTDGDPRRPVVRPDDPTASSGRGLRIVEQLAARWGTEPTGGGKAVWFEFDLDGAS